MFHELARQDGNQIVLQFMDLEHGVPVGFQYVASVNPR